MGFLSGNFFYNGKILSSSPIWAMTLKEHGNMRFRWNEENKNRTSFFSSLFGSEKKIVQVELIHSKTVLEVSSLSDVFEKRADGLITKSKDLVPTITVADCMPIFIYDIKSGFFGVLHSGWKGTGIIEEAFNLIKEKYGLSSENFCVVLGPHIGPCCYDIDESRAEYFRKNFGESCVNLLDKTSIPSSEKRYSLSLTEANIFILKKLNVPNENIRVIRECTGCFKENGTFKYGSFRRQTQSLPNEMPLSEKQKHFTVQSAFIYYC